GQVAAVLDDAGEATVVDVAFVMFAALAAKAEMDVPTLDRDMPVTQGRQSEAFVLLGVFGVADAEQRQFHQPYDRRQYPLARQVEPLQVFFDPVADQRQY